MDICDSLPATSLHCALQPGKRSPSGARNGLPEPASQARFQRESQRREPVGAARDRARARRAFALSRWQRFELKRLFPALRRAAGSPSAGNGRRRARARRRAFLTPISSDLRPHAFAVYPWWCRRWAKGTEVAAQNYGHDRAPWRGGYEEDTSRLHRQPEQSDGNVRARAAARGVSSRADAGSAGGAR